MAHPNQELLQHAYEAFAKGDMDHVMSVFDEDIIWHSPGRSPLAGTFRGRAQVQEFFGRLFEMSGGTFSNEVHDILANDEHAVVLVKVHAERQGKSLDTLGCHVWHLKGSKATEFWNLTVDPYEGDAFWE